MNGTETAYDPSRHGPMVEARSTFGQGGDPRLLQAKQPLLLRELSQMLEEAQSQGNEIAGRLHNHADSLLGPQPEPGADNGNKPLPPPAGQVHQILDAVNQINRTLREARAQLDRFDRL